MKTVQSYFVIAEEGKTLMRDGKPMGAAVWLAPGKTYDDVENVGSVEPRMMIFPEQGKILRHKDTKELSQGRWLKDTFESDWEEIDEPEE